jgi:hypothetical protein
MPHSKKTRVDIGPTVTKERARERAYLLYSRGRGAEQYLSLLEGRRAPRLLGSTSPNRSRSLSQAGREFLTPSLGISE